MNVFGLTAISVNELKALVVFLCLCIILMVIAWRKALLSPSKQETFFNVWLFFSGLWFPVLLAVAIILA